MTLARAHAAAGEHRAANELMPRILAEPGLWRGGGRLAMRLRNWDLAEDFWNRISNDQSDVEADLQLARVFTHQGRLSEAIEAAEKVLHANPDHSEAMSLRTNALRLLDRDAGRVPGGRLPLSALFLRSHHRSSRRTPSQPTVNRERARRRARVRHLANGFFREAKGDCARAFIAYRNAHHLEPDQDSMAAIARTRGALLRHLVSDRSLVDTLFPLLQRAGVLVDEPELEAILRGKMRG